MTHATAKDFTILFPTPEAETYSERLRNLGEKFLVFADCVVYAAWQLDESGSYTINNENSSDFERKRKFWQQDKTSIISQTKVVGFDFKLDSNWRETLNKKLPQYCSDLDEIIEHQLQNRNIGLGTGEEEYSAILLCKTPIGNLKLSLPGLYKLVVAGEVVILKAHPVISEYLLDIWQESAEQEIDKTGEAYRNLAHIPDINAKYEAVAEISDFDPGNVRGELILNLINSDHTIAAQKYDCTELTKALRLLNKPVHNMFGMDYFILSTAPNVSHNNITWQYRSNIPNADNITVEAAFVFEKELSETGDNWRDNILKMTEFIMKQLVERKEQQS